MNQQTTKPLGPSSDDEDEDIREPWMWAGKNAYIFLVDATEPMFSRDINDNSYIQMALEACKSIMIRDIYDNKKDLFGIVLYGTKRKGQGAQANHVTILQDLASSNADRIKDIINILDDVDEFEKLHGHSGDFSLAEALWHCSKMVSSCTTKLYQKRVLLMTCNDDPHSTDRKLQHDTRTRVNDLNQVDICLKVLAFGINFNPDPFFKEVAELSNTDDEVDQTKIKIINEVEDVCSFVEHLPNKRSSSRVFWSLGGGVKLGVAAYSFIKSAPPFPKKVKIERSKNSVVTSKVQAFNADTGEEVAAADISKAVTVGGQTITFNPEELKTSKYLTQAGLVLLGFKPTHTIALWHQIKSALFLYPEERLVKGSRSLFAALHEKCLTRKVSPICYFTARRGGKPNLVALIPQEESLDKKRAQISPPGFILRYLPYLDNVRDLKDQQVKCPYPEPELVTLAEKIIDKAKFRYNPHSIDNPKLKKHWAGVEALALGYENPEEVDDHTVADWEAIDKRVDVLAIDFMNMAFPEGFDEEVSKKATKRVASAKPPPQKKVKPDLENMDMADVANQGLVDKLKVDDLKEYLTSVGVKPTKMKKAELVMAVYDHLGINPP